MAEGYDGKIVERFQIAFEAAPGPVLLVGPDGKIALTNRALDQLLGYDDNALVGKRVEVLVPAGARNFHPELRDAFFECPSSRHMGTGRDLHACHRDGRLIPVEIGLNPVNEGEQSFVLVSILDITERKKQEQRIRVALDAAASAMIMVDAEGRIVLVNAHVKDMFGYEESELIRQPVEMLMPEAGRRRHGVYRTSFLTEPTKRSMGRGRSLLAQRKDGSVFPVEIALTPIQDSGGGVVMATVIDVTESRRIQREMAKQNERQTRFNTELIRLNEELSQFAYSASHDLKAPLSTIQGLLHYALSDLQDGDQASVQDILQRCRTLTKDLAERVEGVLGLASSENLEDPEEEFHLKDVVHDVLLGLGQAISERKTQVKVEVDEIGPLHMQRVRMLQVLDNLIANACKFADPHKERPEIVIRAREDGALVRIEVADNGIGIREQRSGEVFKLFRRLDNHDAPGSGIGLALVKKHVDRLNGTVEFTSSPQGTCFVVKVPRRRAA
ncbi:MAG: PAS domain-containing sensor histidine kinase [Candidatus Eisenbacteria bacterium]